MKSYLAQGLQGVGGNGLPAGDRGGAGHGQGGGSQPASVRLIAGCHATMPRPGMLRQPEHGKARQSREKWCCNGAARSSSEGCTVLRWRLITPLVTAGKPQLGPSPPAPLLFPSAPREVLHPPCPSLQLSHAGVPSRPELAWAHFAAQSRGSGRKPQVGPSCQEPVSLLC